MLNMLKNREEEKVWLLDATDRCDRCGAQAYVRAIVTGKHWEPLR